MARHLRRIRTALIAGLLLGGYPAMAAELAVIVAADLAAAPLEAGMLRDIYLKKTFLDEGGRKIVPVNLPVSHPVREAFSRALFHQDSSALQGYWNQRYFHGIRPPYVLQSQAAVVRFVARTPGAIGYVAPCFLEPDVVPVLRLPVPADSGINAECPAPPR